MGSTRKLLLVVLVLCAYQPSDAVAGTKKRVPAQGCFKPGKPLIKKLKEAAAARTRAAYRAELRRRGLKPARVGPHNVRLHRGIRGGPNQRGFRVGRMVTIPGRSGRYLAGGSYWSGTARPPRMRRMVTDGTGNFYFVQPWPIQATFTDVVLCGCTQLTCGPYGSGCPACGATSQLMYGPFGPNDKFRGTLKIVHASYVVKTRYQRGWCPLLRKCPPPPPSMRRR